MEVSTKQMLIDFTKRAFDYYNGKINREILARLEVSTVIDTNDPRAAYTRYPNIVRVQPLNIYDYQSRFNNHHRVTYHIIESVIHELYHVEQFLMYSRTTSVDYVRSIEADVDFMTATYILGHVNEIYNIFGVSIDEETIEYLHLFRPYKNKLYQRKTIFDHICLFVDDTIGKSGKETVNRVIKQLVHYVEEVPDSVIRFIVNGNTIVIKDKDYYIDINEFNQKVYEYHHKYTNFQNIKASIQYNETEYNFIIDTKGNCNIMAKVVGKEYKN